MSSEPKIYLVVRGGRIVGAWQTDGEAKLEARERGGHVTAVPAEGALLLALVVDERVRGKHDESGSVDMTLACNVKLRWAAALGRPSNAPPATATLEQMTAKALLELAPEAVVTSVLSELWLIIDRELTLASNTCVTAQERARLLRAKRAILDRTKGSFPGGRTP